MQPKEKSFCNFLLHLHQQGSQVKVLAIGNKVNICEFVCVCGQRGKLKKNHRHITYQPHKKMH